FEMVSEQARVAIEHDRQFADVQTEGQRRNLAATPTGFLVAAAGKLRGVEEILLAAGARGEKAVLQAAEREFPLPFGNAAVLGVADAAGEGLDEQFAQELRIERPRAERVVARFAIGIERPRDGRVAVVGRVEDEQRLLAE